MLRMGDTYAKENNLEHAYILYVRYLTLFVEKVRRFTVGKCKTSLKAASTSNCV